jgi:hypothetical protein
MAVSLSALRAGRPLPPHEDSWWLSRPQGHRAAGRISSIEKSNDLIGTRTPDLPANKNIQFLLIYVNKFCSPETNCKMIKTTKYKQSIK